MHSRFETRPPWWFMYDTMDLLSERTSTWCPRMTGRKNWQAWHAASISGSWCAGSIPPQTTDRRSVCPRTALPNPCWKRLLWQPSFCVLCLDSRLALARGGSSNGSGLIHRPESPLRRGGVRDAKLLLEPSVSLGQNEPVVEVVEYADSHLSQRGESRIHASCKSAGARNSPNGRTLYW